MTFPGLGEPFPEREEDILRLAMRMIETMERDPERFRDAPFSAADLRAALKQHREATAAADAAEQAERKAFADKDQSLDVLKRGLKEGLWSVEVEVRGQPERLSGLGWGGSETTDRVQRRKPGGAWEYVATAADNDCLVSDQPRGIELDLRVVAVNRAGAGEPSVTVTVVL